MNNISPEQTVRDFFALQSTQGFSAAYEKYLHPNATWGNTGFPTATGMDTIKQMMAASLAATGMPYGRIELKNVAVNGNIVLTERVDHLFNDAGDEMPPLHIMGALTVENGKIMHYFDYFDSGPFKKAIGHSE